MKRKPITLLAIALVLFMPATASAVKPLQYNDVNSLFTLKLVDPDSQLPFTINMLKPDPEPITETVKLVEVKAPDPIVYTVMAGDNLTKIGTAYNVEWQRLWAKNTEIKHPDLIYIGDKITIPMPSEQLERAIPVIVSLPQLTPGVAPLRDYDGTNTYDYGYCTWYVKNRRGASLPNSLGNANTWYARAAAAGMAVGYEPRAGAVGTTTQGALGHVVYVESVNNDGTVNISEMNAPTWGETAYRTTAASEFVYIY